MKLLKSSLLFSATLAAALTAVNSSAGEILTNAGFEDGLTGWNPTTYAISSSTYYSTNSTSSCVLQGNQRTNCAISQNLSLEPGALYHFQFDFAAQGDSTNQAELLVGVYTSGGAEVFSSVITHDCSNSPTFFPMEVAFTCPDNCTQLYVIFKNVTTKDVNVGAIVDNASLIALNYVRNGSFEEGPIGCTNYWSISGCQMTTDAHTDGSRSFCIAFDDNNPTAKLSQNVSLPEGYHLLSFDSSPNGNQNNIGDYSYLYVEILINGVPSDSFCLTNISNGNTNFVTTLRNINLSSEAVVTISFYSWCNEQNDVTGEIVDNVRIE